MVAASGLCQSVRIVQSFLSRYSHPPDGGSVLKSLARTFASSEISVIPTVRSGTDFVSSVGTATAAPGQKATGYFRSPRWGRRSYQYSSHRHQRGKARSCPGSCVWAPTALNTRSSRLKNSPTYLIPLRSSAPLFLCRHRWLLLADHFTSFSAKSPPIQQLRLIHKDWFICEIR